MEIWAHAEDSVRGSSGSRAEVEAAESLRASEDVQQMCQAPKPRATAL